jgi:hypothetical protein
MTSKKSQRNEATAPQDVTAEAASPAKKLPIKTIRVDDVSCSIFAHERERNGARTVNYSCGFSRSYKDRDGAWRHSTWFGIDELGALVSCAQQAHEYITSLTAPAADSAA